MANGFPLKPKDTLVGHAGEAPVRPKPEQVTKSGAFGFRGIRNKDIVFFTREFSVLLNAGVPLVESLKLLTRQVKNKQLQAVVKDLQATVEGGAALSVALAAHPDVFNNLFVSLAKTGEVSGTLDKSLNYIADQLEKDYNLRRKVKGALSYPIFVLVAMFAVMGLLFTFVMPRMLTMIDESGVDLPLTTRMLVFVTDLFVNFWWLMLIIILGGIGGFHLMIKTQGGRLWWDKYKLKIPLFGAIAQNVYLERFSRNFAILIKGGVPIVQGLRISSDAVGNEHYRKILLAIAKEVENGSSLTDAFNEYPNDIPDLLTQMLSVGEKTSKIDEILFKIAAFYESESEQKVSTLTQLLEPIIILALGAVVAMIVSGVLLPIYNLILSY